ncbi:hypothetical protein [Bombella mellum]|uniref:hypothetical protein n=1 Tax=Bombella mellum TaxID=2039288 RepID=UPI0015F71013|nr:hypothetical protein [Bombella mellum]
MSSRFFDMLRRALPVVPLALCMSGQAKAAPAPSLCAPDEQVAFSCHIARSHKIVSLCLAPGKTNPPAARYVFGTSSHPELIYPSNTKYTTNFQSSYLMYMGPTSGEAYSFINADTKYILYEIDGYDMDHNDFMYAGILIQPVGQLDASAELHCKSTSNETINSMDVYLDSDLLDRTKNWQVDSDLADHGLPSTK